MWRYIYLLLSGTACLSQNVFQINIIDTVIADCHVRINLPCLEDDVTLTLYSSDQDVGKVFHAASPDIGLWFDPRRPTKILIGGYTDVEPNSPFKMIIKAYQNYREPVNIIHVEWLKLSSPAQCFHSAVLNAPHVGKCTAQLLFAIEKNYPEFEPWKSHFIAFSLGANVVAHTSRIISEERNVTLRRITGLDPTNHFLGGFGPWGNLDANDAEFVDVIHTSAGLAGAVQRIGDVDFYVNGGIFQKRCQQKVTTVLKGIQFLECIHVSAPLFFAESVNSDVGFWGIKCASVYHALFGFCPAYDTQPRALMGDRCSINATGIYHVNTNAAPLYARGYPRPRPITNDTKILHGNKYYINNTTCRPSL